MQTPSFKRFRLVLPSVLLVAAFHAASAAEVTWTGAVNGNWSTGSNWSTNPNPPANDGTDVVKFNFGSATTRTTGMDADWNVKGILGTSGIAGNSTARIVGGALTGGGLASPTGSGTLSLGTDGIKLLAGSTGVINLELGSPTVTGNQLTVNTTGDQSWQLSDMAGGPVSQLTLAADLTGTGVITINAGYNSLSNNVVFNRGSTHDFTGSFTLESGKLVLNGTSQLGRLGSNALTIRNANPGASGLGNSELQLLGLSATTQTFANAINFVNVPSSTKYNILHVNDPTAGAEELIWSGDWSGAMEGSLLMKQRSRTLIQRIQGNNSGLTSSLASGAINLQSGQYLLESNNAFGTNNGLSVSLGGQTLSSSTFGYGVAALYAKNGVTVNSRIEAGGSNEFSAMYKLGILESGTATYTGRISMANNAANTGSANMHFVAENGGRVNFTGTIDSTQTSLANKVPVIVEGGGSVALSGNNTYHGVTSVIEGTTLLANSAGGSSTGAGSVYVGFAGQNFAGTTTINTTTVTVASTAGLVAGMKVSGAGIPPGAFITWVEATRFGISELATASGTVAISGAAETGILGGTGIVRPGAGASVLVAAGSRIAPGDGGIGALKFDGADTSAAVLSLASDAEFSFELGAANIADKVSFWNYAAGDFVLNSNVINFTGAQEGTYTLFDFYSDAGTTLALSGISSGLVIGTGLDGFNYTLNYNASSITLDLTVVPEPGTAVLVSLGGLALALRSRRRRE